MSTSAPPLNSNPTNHQHTNQVSNNVDSTVTSRNVNNQRNRKQKQRYMQALKDANEVTWEDRNNFNLCSVVITTEGHSNGTSGTIESLYDSVFNLQDDYEHGVDWDEVPMLQREQPPAYLQDLDFHDVEEFVRKSYRTRKTADEFSMAHITSSSSEKELPSWEDTVPGIFFLDDFDLTDPLMFEQVLNLTKNENSNNDFTDQQDILTNFLDTVESALLEQVKTRSTHFFSETKRFQNLKDLVNEGRIEVEQIHQKMVTMGLKTSKELSPVPKDALIREHLKGIELSLEHVSALLGAKDSIGGLLAARDFTGAIQTIHRTREIFFQQLSTSQGLSSLSALCTVENQLNDYETLVIGELSDRLIALFMEWELSDETSISSRSSLAARQTRKNEIEGLIHALQLCNVIPMARKMYIDRLSTVMGETIDTIVTECAADIIKNTDVSKKIKNTHDVTAMSFEQFMGCLDLLFGEILGILKSAAEVNQFLEASGYSDFQIIKTKNGTGNELDEEHDLSNVAEVAHKSVCSLMRQRKDLHSLISFDEMRRLWDACLSFTLQLEGFTVSKVYGLRSTLLAHVKGFTERKHENHMAALVAALDSEKWVQVNVSPERQSSLTHLTTGRAALASRKSFNSVANCTLGSTEALSPVRSSSNGRRELTEADVEGSKYKLVWSCLVLIEMIMTDVACAAHFQTLASNIVGKVTELLRLFNSRTTQLVLGAGALQSSAKLKSINAKHLALVTQSLGLLSVILPHLRAALMAQLPAKQHTLLNDLDRVKEDFSEHSEKCLAKFVSIVGGIVERALAPFIFNTNFDERAAASEEVVLCKFLNGIVTNVQKMYSVLKNLLPLHDLQDVYSRIFAYVDQKVPVLFIAAASKNQNGEPSKRLSSASTKTAPKFAMPKTFEGKTRMIQEIEIMTQQLQFEGIMGWSFSAPNILRRHLDLNIQSSSKEQEQSSLSCSSDKNESMNPHSNGSTHVGDQNGEIAENGTKEEVTSNGTGDHPLS